VTSTTLPQLQPDTLFLTDGGLETTLVFRDGIELPDFAAFPLVDSEKGRAALAAYYAAYLDLAERLGLGIVLDTPTWRANPDWGARLGYDAEQLAALNRRAVKMISEYAAERASLPIVLNGVIGPRGDGYVVGSTMSAAESAAYHALQVHAFADAGAQMVSAITMTYADEAIGVAMAASAAGLPAVISFTVETDGALPSGQKLGDAITHVDNATDGSPSYYMVNCAHPTHFAGIIEDGGPWTRRIQGLRANASRLSHAELDEATELDRGDIDDLARRHVDLHRVLDLRVLGGCCGTDDEHVAAIVTAIRRDDEAQ